MTTEDTRPDPAGSDAAGADAGRPAPALFRAVPLVSLVAVGFVVLGTSTIAFQANWWFAFFLIPLAMAWWVLRTRTLVDADGLHVRTAFGSRSLPWSSVATLRVVEHRRIRAVRSVPGSGSSGSGSSGDPSSGPEFSLPGVRVRDLGRVGEASGGRLRVPSPAEAEAAAERERELAATRLRIAKLRERQGPDPDDSDIESETDTETAPESGEARPEAAADASDPERDGEQGRPGA